MGRRSSTGITDFLSDIVDDIKYFVDDEVIDRGRDSERDLRRAGRTWTDDDRRRGSGGRREDDLDELRRSIARLGRKINALSADADRAASRPAPDSGTSDLPISGYDDLTAAEITGRLGGLSQDDLIAVDTYERANANRTTVTGRIESLRGEQPWADYDGQTVAEVRQALSRADEDTRRAVRGYEAKHKNRQGVLDAVDASLSA